VTATATSADPEHPTAEPPTVAVFDFDGTLTRGGSVFPFLVKVRGLLPVLLAVGRDLPGLVRAALFSGNAADRFKETLFTRLLSGIPAERVDRVAASFAESHLAARIRPEMKGRLEWHRARGHWTVVVSASPECYVKVAAAALGADAALATRLQTGGGLLTGRFEGKNCRGTEKYARLTGWLRSEGLSGTGSTPAVLWAYGNSRGDLRLLAVADHGVDAGRLGRLGSLRRYPRLDQVLGAGTAPGTAGTAGTAPGAQPVTEPATEPATPSRPAPG
jgi:phosphatidylglycerophosphatase C